MGARRTRGGRAAEREAGERVEMTRHRLARDLRHCLPIALNARQAGLADDSRALQVLLLGSGADVDAATTGHEVREPVLDDRVARDITFIEVIDALDQASVVSDAK